LVKADDGFSTSGTACVSTPGGQILEQGIQTMDGPSLLRGLGEFLSLDALGWLRFGDGVTRPTENSSKKPHVPKELRSNERNFSRNSFQRVLCILF